MSDTISVFPLTAATNTRGRLTIGGCDVADLARAYSTPVYLFDVATLHEQCRAHVTAFSTRYPDSRVFYAGKAYLGTLMAQLVRDEGLGLDVVSGGELYVAREAGFPTERICFHGNNKSADELRMALDSGVGRIAVDNLDELALLADIAESKRSAAPVLLRLAPGIDPHTHAYLATGVADSKFGLPVATGMAAQAVAQALASPWLQLRGYHVHIGSQIHDLSAYRQAADIVMAFAAGMRARHGFAPPEVCLGGGWAVPYLPGDVAPSPDEVAEVLVGAVRRAWALHGLPLPSLSVEPGRALVARAGVAVYTVGAVKEIEGVRRYVFVDGGMADNIRPALYGARYAAVVANRMQEPATMLATIAGPYCESGDVLIYDAMLPDVQQGDVICVAACGAYTLSMASNYNMALRPPVLALKDGVATLWRRRETYADLLRCEGEMG